MFNRLLFWRLLGGLSAVLLSGISTGIAQYQWPSYIYDNQMEIGDVWGFTLLSKMGTGSVVEVTNTVAHSGTYALRCYFAPVAESRRTRVDYVLNESPNWVPGRTNYCRFYLFISPNSTIPPSKYFNVFTWSAAGAAALDECRVYNDSGTYRLRSSSLGVNGGEIKFGQWHCIESKWFSGAGNGQLAYWLDGTQVMASNTLNSTNPLVSVQFGQAGYMAPSETGISQEIYIDDVRVDNAPIGPLGRSLRLYVPDLRGRSGVPALAVCTEAAAGDTILWQLSTPTVTNDVLTNAVSGAVRARISLRSLASGQWTLRATLRDSSGTPKASDSYSWLKSYEGDPPVSIDEYNRFVVGNSPIFLLGNFADRYDNSQDLYTLGAIDVMTGGSWNNRTPAGMKAVMDKMWAVGCRTEAGFPFPDSPAPTTNFIMSFLTSLHNHPGMFSWFFEDEPELISPYPVPPFTHYGWQQMTKAFDGRWNVGLNFLGASFAQYLDCNGNTFGRTESQRTDTMTVKGRDCHRYCYPWLVADYYGNDTYPYSYTNQASMTTFAAAARRCSSWNYGLVPSITFIQPYALRTSNLTVSECPIPPTTNQVQLMFWTSVAAGASGARWFEYHVPRENWTNGAWSNMSYVGLQARLWNKAITGIPLENVSCGQEYVIPQDGRLDSGRGGVVFKATTFKGTNFIFAANLSQTVTNVTFTFPEFKSGDRVRSYYDNRWLIASEGSFKDTIEFEGFRVYVHAGPVVPPPAPRLHNP